MCIGTYRKAESTQVGFDTGRLFHPYDLHSFAILFMEELFPLCTYAPQHSSQSMSRTAFYTHGTASTPAFIYGGTDGEGGIGQQAG